LKHLVLHIALIFLVLNCSAQKLWQETIKRLDEHQLLLDQVDGTTDNSITLQSDDQSSAATHLYIGQIDLIQELIINSRESDLAKKQMLWDLLSHFKGVNSKNLHLYSSFQSEYQLIEKCLKWVEGCSSAGSPCH